MSKPGPTWTARHSLVLYFALAYAFSWLIWLPLAASVNGLLAVQLSPSLHYLSAYGPLLAALLTTWLTCGRGGLRALWASALRWRVGVGWLLFAAVSPVALWLVSATVLNALGMPAPDWRQLGVVNYLPDLGLFAWPLWILNSGLGEEIGWRGFALPRLQQRHNALTASLILGALWAGWHLPAFFILPGYRSMGLSMFPGFMLLLIAAAVVYTWLYNGTGGSVLPAILFHGAFNFVTASQAGDGLVAAILSTVVAVWAVVVIILYKPATLAPQPRIAQTEPITV